MTALDLQLQLLVARLDLASMQLQVLGLQVAAWLVTHPGEALACACGLVGSMLLARRGDRAHLGWLAFLASNGLWLWFAWHGGHYGLFVQQLGFTVTSLVGLYVWLIKPYLTLEKYERDFERTFR